MSTSTESLLHEMQSLSECDLAHVIPGLVNRIKSLPVDEQRQLVRETLGLRTAHVSLEDTSWNPSRTLVGIVLHATGVRTIEGPEEADIRRQLQRDFANLDGDPNAFRSLQWISAAG